MSRKEQLIAELRRRRALRDPTIWYPHAPEPKQREFLALTCLEALYGGAAGGGKTDALLMAAAQYVHVPGYAALVLRRTFPELAKEDAIMERAKRWWLPKHVAWNEQLKRFRFPSGATVSFGYLDTDRDKYQYQSAAFQCVVFDELTEFPEPSYRFLFSRLRRLEGSDVPLRMRAASNPGGIGHDWVKKRFVDAATRQGVFVPARLEDNPHLDQAAYRESLSKLDSTTRRQLEEGEWVRSGVGLVYGDFDPERNLLLEAPSDVVKRLRLDNFILGIDFGTTSPNAFSVVGWATHSRIVVVLESYKRPGALAENIVTDEIRPLQTRYPFRHIAGDIGGLGKQLQLELTRRFGVPLEAAEKTNKLGFVRLLNGALSRGELLVCADTCLELVDEWQTLPWDERGQHEAAGFANHCADAGLYAWRACFAYLEEPAEVRPKPGSREALQAQADEWERLAVESQERDPWEEAGF